MSEVSILAVVNFLLSGSGIVNNQLANPCIFVCHFAKHFCLGLIQVDKFQFYCDSYLNHANIVAEFTQMGKNGE
ncbi:MAG TPA: hypothetical protein DDW76_12800 [Cyanobacteria bacterium UBA11369]|nr:hypothetical protein [Cyanobacteria bacterium UBA11371]HBE34587.1 hypothetical protein [Cyanobacteria bacterium UBA11368]HBE49644.1 hypothetical protein [Cyanobacteria bacterium UBA11369]